jgi:hypothetical protein
LSAKENHMLPSEARQILSAHKKIINRSPGFGDAEVYYYDGDKKVNEGYMGNPFNKSSITVNGVEFKGLDAFNIMKK